MKKIYLITVIYLISIYSISAQIEGKYKLSVYENYTFGEYSPSGKFRILMRDKNGLDICILTYTPQSKTNEFQCSIPLDIPFIKIDKNFRNYYEMDIDESYINNQIDSVFNKMLKILESNNRVIKLTLPAKSDFITHLNIIYKSDTLIHSFKSDCEWTYRIQGSDHSVIRPCKLIPKQLEISHIKNKNVYCSEKVQVLGEEYTNYKYEKWIYSWNNDSTSLTFKIYNLNNTLVAKLMNQFSNKLLVSQYIFDSQTGVKKKIYDAKYLGENLKEEINYRDGEIVNKKCFKYDSQNNFIENITYVNNPYLKELTVSESLFYTYEYNKENKITRQLVTDENKIPIVVFNNYFGVFK